MSWLTRWFRSRLKNGKGEDAPSLEPRINRGEEWALEQNNDPWGGKEYPPVKIIDVRDGWVRYDMGGSIFRDERKTIGDFVALYRLKTPNVELSGREEKL